MLQKNNLLARAAVCASGLPSASARDVLSLVDGMRALGCNVPAPARNDSHTVCGASTALSVQRLLRSPAEFDEVATLIRQYAASDMGLTLTLRDLGDGDESINALESLCSRLHDAGIPKSPRIGICMKASTLPLRAYALITQCWLGTGPRYVLMGSPQMYADAAETGVAASWEYLWRLRSSRWAVLPAYGENVSTQCPLLTNEKANAMLPAFGIQAPTGSAWLPVQLHLPRFADAEGVVCREKLDRALTACIDTGEQLLDLLSWPLANMQRDARLNRRIAIVVTGFGDLVRLQKKDPSDFHVLQPLLVLAEHIHTTLWGRSMHIARRSELLPAIARHEPLFEASDEHHKRSWAARWQGAVERSAVRHRNLLVMSPYSVLPTADGGCAAFTDLLPVIGFADAHSFAAPPSLQHWKFKDFRHFHRRAWAVIRRRHGASLIATRA